MQNQTDNKLNFSLHITKMAYTYLCLTPIYIMFILISLTAWKVSKYRVISGKSPYSVPNTGKYGPEIIPYLDTFQAVSFSYFFPTSRCCSSCQLADMDLKSVEYARNSKFNLKSIIRNFFMMSEKLSVVTQSSEIVSFLRTVIFLCLINC